MLFNSLQFGVFLPVVFGLYWALPNRFRWPVLLVSSYYFYMSWNVKYVVLILFTTVVSYLAARGLARFKSRTVRHSILWLTLIACLGVLFVFKYFNFFFDSLSVMARGIGIQLHPVTLRLLLPVGISFYTFQTLSYVIDVYRGAVAPEKNLGIYATFISFFPQLVAGPIERTSNLLPQIRDAGGVSFDYNSAMYGMREMLWGFFKKLVIADNLAVYVDKVFNNLHDYQGLSLLLATFFFTIQIYCDFSGYSDIARGTARLFGIRLMENFHSPYLSTSVRDFWSRWHISLSTWFRDYVYIPLGGNRVSKARHRLNLMITFIISGLWHGANWTFVIWGAVHGLAQILTQPWDRRKRSRNDHRAGHFLGRLLATFITFIFCMFAWIFFRANTIADAGYVFQSIVPVSSSWATYFTVDGIKATLLSLNIGKINLVKIAVPLLLLFIHDLLSQKTDIFSWIGQRGGIIRYSYAYIIALMILVLGYAGQSTFVYFQF